MPKDKENKDRQANGSLIERKIHVIDNSNLDIFDQLKTIPQSNNDQNKDKEKEK
jgi:hypothetical protein